MEIDYKLIDKIKSHMLLYIFYFYRKIYLIVRKTLNLNECGCSEDIEYIYCCKIVGSCHLIRSSVDALLNRL